MNWGISSVGLFKYLVDFYDILEIYFGFEIGNKLMPSALTFDVKST